ncbi:hypothetical protein ACJX0J_028662, partial [Zea mays]
PQSGGVVSRQASPAPAPASGAPDVKKRGRPSGPSSKKQQPQAAAPGPGWTGLKPHIFTVQAGEDVASRAMSFSGNGWAVCILTANGTVSNVTLRQGESSGGTVTYEGRFEILSLAGRTGGLSVSLASPDGHIPWSLRFTNHVNMFSAGFKLPAVLLTGYNEVPAEEQEKFGGSTKMKNKFMPYMKIYLLKKFSERANIKRKMDLTRGIHSWNVNPDFFLLDKTILVPFLNEKSLFSSRRSKIFITSLQLLWNFIPKNGIEDIYVIHVTT